MIIFSVHLLISFFIIFFPLPIGSNRFTDIYRRYLLPGPFFSGKTIDQTHLLALSWKDTERWHSVNPTLNHFYSFFTTGNPSKLYKTRLERSIYENWQITSESKRKSKLNFDMTDLLKYYVANHDLPQDYDSVSMIFLRKTTGDFKVSMDTLQILKF